MLTRLAAQVVYGESIRRHAIFLVLAWLADKILRIKHRPGLRLAHQIGQTGVGWETRE